MKKLIVFGGTGYVGRSVLRAAVGSACDVVCVSRRGRDSVPDAPWVNDVEFVQADATIRSDVACIFEEHPDATGVISCIGAIKRNQRETFRLCGDASVNVVSQVYERPDIERMLFVSACDFGPVNYLLSGYYDGKRMVEKAMKNHLHQRGVVFRPGFIHGTRRLTKMSLPLWAIGKPMETVLRPIHKALRKSSYNGPLNPPIDVDVLSRAAVVAVTDPVVRKIDKLTGGVTEICDYWDMLEMEKRYVYRAKSEGELPSDGPQERLESEDSTKEPNAAEDSATGEGRQEPQKQS